jgi:hypothetical protein
MSDKLILDPQLIMNDLLRDNERLIIENNALQGSISRLELLLDRVREIGSDAITGREEFRLENEKLKAELMGVNTKQ